MYGSDFPLSVGLTYYTDLVNDVFRQVILILNIGRTSLVPKFSLSQISVYFNTKKLQIQL